MTGAVVNILIFCLMLIVSFLWEHKRNVVAFTTVKHECPNHLKNTETQTFIAHPQKYSGATGSKEMNKCKLPQLALALSGGIMDLATQNDYMPLEIMTDCAKRSYFTHSFSSLWGYHAICVAVVSVEACGPPQPPWVPEGVMPSECPA